MTFFFDFLMDIAGTSSPAKEYLYKLEEYKKQASTTKDAYKRLSLETGISSNSFRLVTSKKGLARNSRSLATLCLMYAHQNLPVCFKEFIELASIFAKKEEDKYFSYRFVSDFVDRHTGILLKKNGKSHHQSVV